MDLGRLRLVVPTLVVAALIALLPLEAGAFGSARVAAREGVTRATVARVKIVDNAFRPRAITVARGARVRWRNAGTNVHTVQSKAGTWGSALLSPGDTFGHLFRKVGTFRYYCTVHPTMTGSVTVT